MPNKTRTYRDRSSYLINAVSKRRQLLKRKAVRYKGGCCSVCGYSKYIGALEFHHVDPASKEFGLGLDGLTRSWERIKNEVDKCVLLCSNCHRELHAGLISLQ